MKITIDLSPVSLVVGAVLALGVAVSAQTLQRPATLDKRPLNSVIKTLPVPTGPVSSSFTVNPPSPPDVLHEGPFVPLTLRVSEPTPNQRPIMVSVTRPDGSPFWPAQEAGAIKIYSPHFEVDRTRQILSNQEVFFGKGGSACKVSVRARSNIFTLYLTCQKSDPEVPANAVNDMRPFLAIVSYLDKATNTLFRGEAIVNLNGFVLDKL